MTSSILTSELEAINVLLSVADEAPVQSLTVPGLLPLTRARSVLDEANRLIQSLGWAFNTEDDYVLAKDSSSGEIALPANMLKVDVNDEYLGSLKPVQRGSRLYDAKAHSFVFDRDIKATVVLLLAWEDLPQPARHYITIKAARTFQARQQSDNTADGFTELQEFDALLALQQHEADVGDHNVLRDNASCASILSGFGDYYLTS